MNQPKNAQNLVGVAGVSYQLNNESRRLTGQPTEKDGG